ncbi:MULTISPECIES: EAL domain-containing protein [Pseudomonadati]|uniref:EAL domain-containing protein n=1 Tax=Shewanella aestuarii TaxID=1028752 RepID=A0ABT0L119_9GAMM|nr:EAL domain-containing protein [Shewanella aestuarii]MCL1117404.1 EAL domain-containing protein [Shewanella aestuarii]GGN76078.1 signaling protein with EAL and C2 domains [Shewanella aestuarii]
MERIKNSLVFVAVLLTCLIGMKGLDHFLARQIIAHDAQVLTDKFEHVIKTSAMEMNKLPPISQKDFQCTPASTEKLRDFVFDAIFIRWAGVTQSGEIFCESNQIIRKIDSIRTHRISENFSLGVVELANRKYHELILVRHFDDLEYTASIIPLKPSYFVPLECDDCLEYSIDFDSVPFLTFGIDAFEDEPFVSKKVQLKSAYFNATFELSGNFEFYQQYSTISWWVIVIVSLLFATWITYLVYRWQKMSASMRSQIMNGIKQLEFIPFYQPIVDSRTQKVIGCEVLMRWQRQDGSLMPPNQFIPYAEDKGLIVEMTKVLLQHVLNDIEKLAGKREALFFSVNIVPEHLDNDNLYQLLKSVVDSGQLKQHRISLEITERLPISDLVAARKMLDKFYAIGIDLKLDDAGTGYGGFSYVQNLGISTLKIDKMFVDTIGHEDNFNAKTIEAIISFAQKSGLSIIAEGVEDNKQVAYLSQHGVHLIQGYVYSKPLPAKQFFH